MDELTSMQKQECLGWPNEDNKNLKNMERGMVRPWVRCLARYFDILLFSFVIETFLIINPGVIDGINNRLLIMLVLFFWMIIESLLLSTLGTTPGKFLFKISVRDKNYNKLRLPIAFARSAGVFVAGLGIGFPPATLIMLIISRHDLKKNKITKWDSKGKFEVLHGKIGGIRTLIAITIFTLLFILIIYGQS